MKLIVYITVTTNTTKYEAHSQSQLVINRLEEGFEILSAVSDGKAIHYILAKDSSEGTK